MCVLALFVYLCTIDVRTFISSKNIPTSLWQHIYVVGHVYQLNIILGLLYSFLINVNLNHFNTYSS